MTHSHFDTKKDGFYGVYWECHNPSDRVIIAMLGDDPEDYVAKCAVKWLLRLGVNVLTMSPAKKHGNRKFGIAGASTTGTLALTAASLIPDASLTIAMTLSDFIWQGFAQGNRDGCKEWPIENESLFTYRGRPLPYMPFCYEYPRYYQVMRAEAKAAHSMLKIMFLIGSSLFVSFAFGNSKECKKTRIDIDNRMKKANIDWKNS